MNEPPDPQQPPAPADVPASTEKGSGGEEQAPRLRSLIVLAPLLVLTFAFGAWLNLHFDTLLGLLGAAPAAGIALVMTLGNKLLPEGTMKRTRADVAKLLTSRRAYRLLWGITIAFGVITLFVSSAHVTRGDDATVWISAFVPSGDAGRLDSAPDSARLDSEHRHRTFRFAIPPTGRKLLLFSADGRQTSLQRVLPWRPVRVIYPIDFDSIATVALLPAGDLMMDMLGGAALRLIVRDAERAVIVDDSLTTVRALLLSFREPPEPDHTVRSRWLDTAVDVLSAEAGVDTAAVAPLVAMWLESRWLATARPLSRGDELDITLLRAATDTVAALHVNLRQAYSDVYISRRP